MASTKSRTGTTATADAGPTPPATTSPVDISGATDEELQARTGLLDSDAAGADKDPNPDDVSPTKAKREGYVVKYVGLLSDIFGPHTRDIRVEDWERSGVEGQKAVEWSEDNGYMIPATEFSAHAIKFLLEVESGFRLEKLDD